MSENEEIYPTDEPDEEVVIDGHAFEEDFEHEASHDEQRIKVSIGEEEEDVYTVEGREEMLDDDEIKPWEEGFVEGAEHGGEQATCAHCGKVLGGIESGVVEREYRGEILFFCSEKCAQAGPQQHPR
ncbi:hypothetical protein D6825_00185 [Candidatus Woesearchaeota archaeon]|nr:MAG: hypothetical protein D6825_00185 [Candidatus Woesearchaeota archaeon]